MTYSVFSQTANNSMTEPMFFGQPVNVARYDQQKHPIFEQLIEKQLSFFWRPEEVDVSRDRIDFNGISTHEQHIFISNLKYQTLLDSIQGRSPNAVLLPLVDDGVVRDGNGNKAEGYDTLYQIVHSAQAEARAEGYRNCQHDMRKALGMQ